MRNAKPALMGVASVLIVAGGMSQSPPLLGDPYRPLGTQVVSTPADEGLPPSSGIQLALERVIPEATIKTVPLEQAIMKWHEWSRVSMHVFWSELAASGVDREQPVSIEVRNIRLDELLSLILREAGGSDVNLAYEIKGNMLWISTAEQLYRESVSIRIYDVRPILRRAIARFHANERNATEAVRGWQMNGATGDGAVSVATNDTNLETEFLGMLLNLTTSTVEPDSWEVNGGRSTISGFDGMLIVRPTSAIHRKLGAFLQKVGQMQAN